MKGILWISGIGVDDSEMKELMETVRKINRRREKENRERLDYVCLTEERTHITRGLENR